MVAAAADLDRHTVTVELRDERAPVGAVVKALSAAGFATGEPAVKGAVKK